MLQQSLIGKTIGGRYQVEALLGQGGMSAVYRAMDPNLRRTVAIKLIHPHLSADPNFVGRFREEAAAVARLRHPNIVQVHDFNVDGETYYMVMEYLIGETLQARLKRLNASSRQMSFSEAGSICTQICDAAGYAHDHELVHRDIKPANIMLDLHGQAILMDFGIVKIIGGDYHTSTGATVGTAMYMAPEQIRSERVDERSDIYSLGVTLYEMVSGRTPYQADSAITLMMMVLNDPLPDLRDLRQDVPAELLAVVLKALTKEPLDRFKSMAEMAAALRQIQVKMEGGSAASNAIDLQPAEPGKPAVVSPPSISASKDRLPVSQKVVPSRTTTSEQGKPIQAVSVPLQRRGAKAKQTRRVNPWIFILIAVGILMLVGGAAAAFIYIRAKQPPDLQLTPISFSTVPVNAQNAQGVVNLGTWNIGSYVVDLAFSPDGTLLGTANNRDWLRFTDYRYYAALWEIDAAKLQKNLLGNSQWVYGVDFSPDGKLFATASDDPGIILWELPEGNLERKIETTMGGITGVAFSPTNLILAGGSWDGIVGLWQVSNGNLLRTLQAAETGIKDVEFSPDGSLLAASTEGSSILIWNVSDGSLLQTLQGHTAAVTSLAFSPDGTLLASASEDQSIRIWKVSDGSLLSTLTGHAGPVKDVAFSVDGSLLVSGSEDGTVGMWQVADGQALRTLPGEDSILSIVFSPDGTYLVSGEANGAVQFWGISEAIPLEKLNVPNLP
jgi:eukaryotic-like serine/threonine-protein kinase